jgi:ABC-type molybdate transport system ATPase subunit
MPYKFGKQALGNSKRRKERNWRRMIPVLYVVHSPKEYVELLDELIKEDQRGSVIAIDWNDDQQDEKWLKAVAKAIQICGWIAHTCQLRVGK